MTNSEQNANFEDWPDDDFKIWMDNNLGKQSPDFCQQHWNRYVECWHTQEVPMEKRETLEKFLREWVKPNCGNERALCQWGTEQHQILQEVLEPLAMALCPPDNPWLPMWKGRTEAPTQEDIDKRLADWLRGVILRKDTSALKSLIIALTKIRCDLHVGIQPDEIIKNLDVDNSDHWSRERIMTSFWQFISEQKRLPNKSEATKHIEDVSARSRYRKELGLNGLPNKPKDEPELVVRKRQ